MSRPLKPIGYVAGPLLILGSVSLVLGFAVEFLGIFSGLERSLKVAWESSNLQFQSELGVTSPLGVLMGAALSYCLVGAILGTPGPKRRLVLGVSSFALCLGLLPVFAVWGIFWKPFGLFLMVFWAWLSASIYANSHQMPCDGVGSENAQNVISLDEKHHKEMKKQRADG